MHLIGVTLFNYQDEEEGVVRGESSKCVERVKDKGDEKTAKNKERSKVRRMRETCFFLFSKD